MLSFNETAKSNYGFSLLEVLIVLTVMALTVSAFSTNRIGPSPAMMLETSASELQQRVAKVRYQAIRGNQQMTIQLDQSLCVETSKALTFYPDGTAQDATVCLQQDTLELHLKLDPLTGQLLRDGDS